jgi:hypothetical protein
MQEVAAANKDRLVTLDLVAFIVLAAAAGCAVAVTLGGMAILLAGAPVPL